MKKRNIIMKNKIIINNTISVKSNHNGQITKMINKINNLWLKYMLMVINIKINSKIRINNSKFKTSNFYKTIIKIQKILKLFKKNQTNKKRLFKH